MNTSEKIAVVALVVPTLFSIIALWQTRGAKAAAAKAEARAVRAETRADEALSVANRQATALESQRDEQAKLAKSVAGLGRQPIEWEVHLGTGSSYYLHNAGSKRADGVWLSGTSGPTRYLPERITLEPGAAHMFIMSGRTPNIVVYCDAEPDGRAVLVPPRR